MPNQIFILTTEFPPGPGGIGNHAWNLAKHLVRNGYPVTVCADNRKAFKSESRRFDEVQNFQIIRNARDLGAIVGILHRIFNLTRLHLFARKDTLIIASGKFSLWFAAAASTIRPGIPIMAVIHGSEINFPSGWKKKLSRWSLRRFQKVIAVSNNTAKIAKELASISSLVTIPNGFDHTRITAFPSNGRLAGDPALITVGKHSVRKGQYNVIQALPKVIEKFPGVNYHMVGIPSQQAMLEKMSEDLAVASKVFSHGAVSDEKLVQALKGSDLFLMLSDIDRDGDIEGFGIAILEANACGIPAIGSIGCGIEDAIADTYSGRLVDPKDSVAVAEAVSDILNNYDQYSANALQWAGQFTWEQVIKQYIQEIEL